LAWRISIVSVPFPFEHGRVQLDLESGPCFFVLSQNKTIWALNMKSYFKVDPQLSHNYTIKGLRNVWSNTCVICVRYYT